MSAESGRRFSSFLVGCLALGALAQPPATRTERLVPKVTTVSVVNAPPGAELFERRGGGWQPMLVLGPTERSASLTLPYDALTTFEADVAVGERPQPRTVAVEIRARGYWPKTLVLEVPAATTLDAALTPFFAHPLTREGCVGLPPASDAATKRAAEAYVDARAGRAEAAFAGYAEALALGFEPAWALERARLGAHLGGKDKDVAAALEELLRRCPAWPSRREVKQRLQAVGGAR